MYFNKEALPKEVFGVGTDAIFEGMKVKVPSDFHRYLSTIFGNYMRMPAETKRIAKHSHSGLNVKKSYIKTLEENRKLNS
jgi:lipopolysaccharide cholinephosphotransferase